MRRLLCAAVLLVGCDDEEPPPGTGCPGAPPLEERCDYTCGNGEIDTCRVFGTTSCSPWQSRTEACDGPAGPTCTELGYYGGNRGCTSFCTIDDTACNACAPGMTCAPLGELRPTNVIAVSGSFVAIRHIFGVAIYDGSQFRSTVAPLRVSTMVGVPGGWLVAEDNGTGLTHLISLDTSGAVVATRDFEQGLIPVMAYGPGNRVLLAWNWHNGVEWRVRFAVAGPDGTVLVPATPLFAGDGTWPAVTTDGTNFFVAAHGNLARIAPDGTFTQVSALPTPTDPNPFARVSWDGTGGWYTMHTGQDMYAAVRFDASGAPIGAPLSLAAPGAADFIADGDDLLKLSFASTTPGAIAPLSLTRIAPDGTTTPPLELGIGVSSATAARRGDDLVVVWSTETSGNLVTITP